MFFQNNRGTPREIIQQSSHAQVLWSWRLVTAIPCMGPVAAEYNIYMYIYIFIILEVYTVYAHT